MTKEITFGGFDDYDFKVFIWIAGIMAAILIVAKNITATLVMLMIVMLGFFFRIRLRIKANKAAGRSGKVKKVKVKTFNTKGLLVVKKIKEATL
jgi:hypothetical protein